LLLNGLLIKHHYARNFLNQPLFLQVYRAKTFEESYILPKSVDSMLLENPSLTPYTLNAFTTLTAPKTDNHIRRSINVGWTLASPLPGINNGMAAAKIPAANPSTNTSKKRYFSGL
jgi:hypothetical protein